MEAYFNETRIDSIHIQNRGEVDTAGRTKYKIVKPEGHEDVDIRHFRKQGWRDLAEQVLHYLEFGEIEI